MTRWTVYIALPLVATFLSGCSDGPLGGLSTGMSRVSGDGQPGVAGQSLGKPFVVRARGAGGVGIPNVVVTWEVTSGAGVLDGRWAACSSPDGHESDVPAPTVSTITDADGHARISFMPTWFGPIRVVARSKGFPGSPVTFSTDATDPDARIEIVAGGEQDGAVDPWAPWVHAGNEFRIRVTDGDGEGVDHVPVVWTLTSGTGRLQTSSCYSTHDDRAVTRTRRYEEPSGAGYSSLYFLPTALGTATVTASLGGVDRDPLVFTVRTGTVVVGLTDNPWYGGPGFVAPGYSAKAAVPEGVAVEFWNLNETARIRSTSEPPGSASFDSGTLTADARFRFVPGVPGVWEFADEISGATGTLTVTAGG